MACRHDEFRLRTIDVRTPIADDSIRAVDAASLAPVPNDRIVFQPRCERRTIESLVKRSEGESEVIPVITPTVAKSPWRISPKAFNVRI